MAKTITKTVIHNHRVFQIDGNGKGVACVIAGTHGNELTPFYAVKLFLESDLRVLKKKYKTIYAVTFLNVPGLYSNSRNFSVDLNRSHRSPFDLLHWVVNNCDVVIDVHSSPLIDNLIVIDQGPYTNTFVDLAKKARVNYLIKPRTESTIKDRAIQNGKYGITIECNRMDAVDVNSAFHTSKIIFQLLNNIPNEFPAKLQKSKSRYKNVKNVICKKDAFYIPGPFYFVVKNETLLAKTVDPVLLKETILRSPCNGKIVVQNEGFVRKSQLLFMIQPLEEK